MRSRHICSICLVIVSTLTLGCNQQVEVASEPSENEAPVWMWATIGAYGTAEPTVDSSGLEIDAKRMATHAWWNQQSMVEALEITPEQRSEMNSLMEAFLSRWTAMSAKQSRSKERINQAVTSGDFDGARRIADDVAWAAAFFQGSPPRLKVEILALLTDEQMQRLINEQAFLLKTNWIRSTTVDTE